MIKTWTFTVLFLAVVRLSSAILEVQENSTVIIQCPLIGEYPTWNGPLGLQNPLTAGQTINEAGFEWVNSRDLKITSAMVKHDGNYTCTDGAGNTETVEVDVQYFSALADISTSTPENNVVNFSCVVYSNPITQVKSTTYSRPIPDQSTNPAKTTFHPCELDPSEGNKTKCSLTATAYVLKQDNGREFTCEFIYKGMSYMTLVRKVNFLFPPTSVKVTGNRPIIDSSQNKLTLTCATDSSNPVSTLTWRKGNSPNASENAVIASTYQNIIMDAEYNGKNITQTIDIAVQRNMDKEKVFCCARHRTEDYCDSITIDFQATSFPPTSVKITGNRPIKSSSQNKLTLTCATDSSNPVSTLTWRKGNSPNAPENAVIASTYQTIIIDAEYNGKNITQKIDIVVERNMDKEKVFCCARHRTDDYCDFVTLAYQVTSKGSAANSMILLLVMNIAFTSCLK